MLLLLTLALLVQSIAAASSSSSSSLAVLVQPSHHVYDFSSGSSLKLSEFKNLLLAAAGFSIQKPIVWKGLTSTNSLSTPRVTVLFLVDSKKVDAGKLSSSLISIDQDTNGDAIIGDLSQQLSHSSQSVAFRTFDQAELDTKNLEEDCSKSSVFYVFKVADGVDNLGDKIKQIYGNMSGKCSAITDQKNDLLVYLLSLDSADHSRVKRLASSNGESGVITNPAIFYSDQYPAMFNIIFWTSLILILAVFGISYSMSYMDPGLNTVIYRMTQQRIKKEQ